MTRSSKHPEFVAICRDTSVADRTNMIVVDPVNQDRVTCAVLRDRANACWDRYYRRYDPKTDAAIRDRDRATAARAPCRRRSQVVLRTCRLPSHVF